MSENPILTNVVYDKKLYGITKTGALKIWECVVKNIGGEGYIMRTSGTLGAKMIIHTSIVSKGKNIGKANETTPVEQAVKDAESKYNKKWDEGYRLTSEDALKATDPRNNRTFKPMLAVSYDKHSKKIVFPCYAQPKLDGVRCLVRRVGNEIIMWSRGGKEFTTLDHLKPALLEILRDGEAADGEIYVHNSSFQKIQEAVSKKRTKTLELQYHIYDYPFGDNSKKDMNFVERLKVLEARILYACVKSDDIFLSMIIPVDTSILDDQSDLDRFEAKCIEEGYEGIMIRNADSPYLFGHRSYDLQKVKRFVDQEFTIVDVVEGSGIETGCAIFVCKAGDSTFKVRPTGSHEQRKEWFNLRAKLIGEELKVKYQELTDDGIPRFPVGLGLRPEWDK